MSGVRNMFVDIRASVLDLFFINCKIPVGPISFTLSLRVFLCEVRVCIFVITRLRSDKGSRDRRTEISRINR